MRSIIKIIALLLVVIAAPVMAEKICSYSSYRWNTNTKQAEDRQVIKKPYASLSATEIDKKTGCTVCEEDQRWIQVGDLEPVRMCHVVAGRVESVLNRARLDGFEFVRLTAYRVGMTRGDIDHEGKRTQFSNHSFGIAIDINPNSNGLYQGCINYSKQCILRRGGAWQPGRNSHSITADGDLVAAMKSVGFKWGGEIAGKQKDFMHFSPSGY